MQEICFLNHRCMGDLVCSQSIITAIHDAYPDEYKITVNSKHQRLLAFDPGLEANNSQPMLVDYAHLMDEQLTMAEAYVADAARLIQRPLKLTQQPTLYLYGNEFEPMPELPEQYIVFNAGSKPDMTIKQIPPPIAEEVVANSPLPCVQTGLPEHNRPIKGAINLIGRTNLRQLMRVAAHATAGFGGDTCLFHICGALKTPYVCIASGRMPPKWLDLYENQTLLTSFGKLDCCKTQGCKQNRVIKLDDNSILDTKLCSYPDANYAKCMQMITADDILGALYK